MLKSKNRKRGFTLVEVIVVLVILAILAAIMIPALTGWIEKSKKKTVIAETRNLHQAVQAVVSEAYATEKWQGTNKYVIASDNNVDSVTLNKNYKDNYEEIVKLSEIPTNSKFYVTVNGKGKIYSIIYRSTDNYLCLYFSETNKYETYKIGEKSGTNEPVSDKFYETYYNSVRYYKPIDANDPNNRLEFSRAYALYELHIGE